MPSTRPSRSVLPRSTSPVSAHRLRRLSLCGAHTTQGDLIWIHDYHLLLVPSLLSQVLPDAAVGLFVHTPFPSSEVFRCVPRRKEILDGMLGANLICFQTYSYSRHFTSSCIRVCGYEVTSRGGIDVQGHVAAIGYCPVGVDADRVAKDT